MLNLASFWKPEACGQTELPDRSVLIGQKLVENSKIQMRHFGWFSNTVLTHDFISFLFLNLEFCFFLINIREASTGFFCLTNEKEKVKRISKNVFRDGKWNDLVRSKRRASFLDDAYFVKFKEFFSAFPFVS